MLKSRTHFTDKMPKKSGPKKPYRCSDCESTFNSRGHLNEHHKLNHEGLEFICEFCQKRYHSPSVLNRHINDNHPSKANASTQTVWAYDELCRWVCRATNSQGESCGYSLPYDRINDYHAHILLHSSIDTFGQKIMLIEEVNVEETTEKM